MFDPAFCTDTWTVGTVVVAAAAVAAVVAAVVVVVHVVDGLLGPVGPRRVHANPRRSTRSSIKVQSYKKQLQLLDTKDLVKRYPCYIFQGKK